MTQIEIDLTKHGGPVYIGRPKGEEIRKIYNLDQIDSKDTNVNVLLPADTYTLNSSFFLGLFGDSVRKCGNRDSFLSKYQFNTSKLFNDKIEDYIQRALRVKKPLI